MAEEKAVRAGGRNYGIDLLRIVAMNMILVLHILGLGGVLSDFSISSPKYMVGWFMEIAAYGAVNLFAIISGYVNYGRKTKYANLMLLYLEILFYTVTATAVYWFVAPETVTRQHIVYALLPFKIGGYWYFTAYFCLFLFMPFMNILVDRLSKRNAVRLLLLFFVVFSVLPTVLYQDIGGMCNGYCFSWLGVMYLTGACIRKFDFRLKCNHYFLLYLLCITASFAAKLTIELITFVATGTAMYGGLFSLYVSPFIVLSSFFLFLGFRDLKLNENAIALVKFFAPMTFGVYLLHMEPLVNSSFILGKFFFLSKLNIPALICGVLVTAFGIWFVCALIDRVRLAIFRVLRVPELCARAETAVRAFVARRVPSSGEE